MKTENQSTQTLKKGFWVKFHRLSPILIILFIVFGLTAIILENKKNSDDEKHSTTIWKTKIETVPQPSEDINPANWPEHDKNLFDSAQDYGRAFERSTRFEDWSNAIIYAEKAYILYFQLAQKHPECWQKVEGSSGSMANAYSHFENRQDEFKLADKATFAIRDYRINHPYPNSDTLEMKPAADLFSKLKTKYPDLLVK